MASVTARNIKRYRNRKMYDPHGRRYVSLKDIASMVRNGDEVTVLDDDTKRDITTLTFAHCIVEEEKRKPRFSADALRKLIEAKEPKKD